MNKNILNKISTLAIVGALAAVVVFSNPFNANLEKASAGYGYAPVSGSTPNTNSLTLENDCRVNGNCNNTKTEEPTKKEEVKTEETKTEKPKETTTVGNAIEKEINGKKYYIINGSQVVITKVLKDITNYTTKFKDISTSSSKEDIIRLEMAEVVKGTTPTTYEPNRAITRAEFLAIVMGAYGYDLTKEAKALPFSDVKVEWQKRVISAALENEIVAGDLDSKGNKVFRPNSQISKIEAYAILSSISGIALPKENNFKHSFTDAAADWQNAVLNEAEYLELATVPTNNKFNPNMGISRADMATLIVKYARLY